MPPIDRHGPVRSCIGCRRRRPQSELVRITRCDGDFIVDGPSSGRGAWLCRDESGCLDAALSRRQFDRAWRTVLDGDDAAAIRAALQPDEEPAD